MGGWSELPRELLDAIGKNITAYADYVRFCAVCVPWKSSLPNRPRLPWLMLPFTNDENNCDLYSLADKKVFSSYLELPEIARGKLYRGSSDGWLFIIDDGPLLKLLNPLTLVHLDLPPLTAFPTVNAYSSTSKQFAIVDKDEEVVELDQNHVQNYFIWKVVHHVPSYNHNDYAAAAIYGDVDKLAFCKGGDKRWTAAWPLRKGFKDAVFHQGKFYAINSEGQLISSDVASLPKLISIKVEGFPKPYNYYRRLYLVSGPLGLMMVERCYGHFNHRNSQYTEKELPGYMTARFNIYKLDKINRRRQRWSEIKRLGNYNLFLGRNSSVLLPVSPSDHKDDDSNNFYGSKGNCIYYTDDEMEFHQDRYYGGFDVGFFNLENGSVSSLPGYTYPTAAGKETEDIAKDNNLLVWPPPVWVLPNPTSC